MDTPTGSPAATLDVAAGALVASRAADAVILRAAADWADQHPGLDAPRTAGPFGGYPVQLGGDGTPEVAEFCAAELAVVLEEHPMAVRGLIGDVLDLRHRLPGLWSLTVDDLAVPDWVARKVARATRRLTLADAAAVDARIAGDDRLAATLPKSRLLALVDALVLASDARAADEERAAALADRFVTVSAHSSRPGTTGVYGCVDDAGGQALDARLDELAAAMRAQGDPDPLDVRRARALVLLADPDAVNALLETPAGEPAATRPAARAVLHLHVTDHTLFGATKTDGLARWEGVGAITRDHLLDLLGHGRVTVRPVWDPSEVRPVDAYEFTGPLREAVLLRTPVDCYPYAVGHARLADLDHTDPWDDDGPPGQTRLDNAGPLKRHHHRIKTSGTLAVRQPRSGVYVWRTPHGHYRRTDHRGTHPVPRVVGDALHRVGGRTAAEAHLASLLV